MWLWNRTKNRISLLLDKKIKLFLFEYTGKQYYLKNIYEELPESIGIFEKRLINSSFFILWLSALLNNLKIKNPEIASFVASDEATLLQYNLLFNQLNIPFYAVRSQKYKHSLPVVVSDQFEAKLYSKKDLSEALNLWGEVDECT